MPVTPFRPPSASVLLDGAIVQTYYSPDGWALVGLTPYTGQRQTGQKQVGYNSNACPTGGTYYPSLYNPSLGYVGYYARAEGCWSSSYFLGASSVSSFWGSWYAPPQPVGPIYEPVYSYFLQYVPTAISANGSTVSGAMEVAPYELLYDSISDRDRAFARHSTQVLGLVVCNPETQIQCGPSLKTSTSTCCLDCATISAQFGGIAAALRSAAGFTSAKADQLAAQAAENRRKARELEGK